MSVKYLKHRVVSVSLVVLASGCGAHSSKPASPISPTPVSSTPPATTGLQPPFQINQGPYVVAGRVVDENGRPLPQASLSAFIDQGTSGYSYTWVHGQVAADVAGRYQLTGLPVGVIVRLQAWQAGYVQQCASRVVTIAGDTTVDVELVSKTNLSSSRSTGAPRLISGLVAEVVDGVRRPVAGAFVDYEPIVDFHAAVTFTDSDGRYGLWGVPETETAEIGVASAGRVGWVRVAPNLNEAPDVVFQ